MSGEHAAVSITNDCDCDCDRRGKAAVRSPTPRARIAAAAAKRATFHFGREHYKCRGETGNVLTFDAGPPRDPRIRVEMPDDCDTSRRDYWR